MNVIIEAPKGGTISFAHALEREYSNLELYSENDGFFIKAEDVSLYHSLVEEDCIRIARIDGNAVGQYMVIPPDHSIMHRLFNSNCMDFFPVLFCIFSIMLFSGCSNVGVKPYQRDLLAKEDMQLNAHEIDQAFDDHIYFSKEASSGGRSTSGGGCGCN